MIETEFKDDFQNFLFLEVSDYTKYRIDEQRSFFFPFSFVKFNTPMRDLFVATDTDGPIFFILYMVDQEEYSKTLPSVKENRLFDKHTKCLSCCSNFLYILILMVYLL